MIFISNGIFVIKLCTLFYFLRFASRVETVGEEYEQSMKDRIALDVINDLHVEMDVDKDGEIDSDEADRFTQDESSFQRSEKIKTHLTKDLLWKSWKNSKVYNWSVEDVTVWLDIEVELSEYIDVFVRNNINGSMIPRLALSDMSFLINTLKISNGTHRRRIALKSKDLILFGPSKNLLSSWKETEAYDVIRSLHFQLDDDKDGGVDPEEANEFVRDELKYIADFDRAKRFNKNDNHISKEELWKNWKSSQVYNWTVDDVIEWLNLHVELSEYDNMFKKYKVDGSTIPRLAATDMSFLIKDLKIKNPVHRKKIALKATDLILFGPPKKIYSILKDSILLTLVFVLISGCWLAYYHYRYSKKQLQHMKDKMNQLGAAEDALTKLQARLEEAVELNSQVNSEKLKIEEKLKEEFEKFKEGMNRDCPDDLFKYKHSEDDSVGVDVMYPEQLKILLQMNYEIEENFFSFKKMAAHQQMQNVKDMCEKLRKKKGSLIGSLRIAHSGNLDEMDKELSEAKIAVDEVRNDLLERSQRWDYIEKLTKFKIIPTPGLSALRSAFTTTLNGVPVQLLNNKSWTTASGSEDSLSDTASNKEPNRFSSETMTSNSQISNKIQEIVYNRLSGKIKSDNILNIDSHEVTKALFNLNDTESTSTANETDEKKLSFQRTKFISTDSLDSAPHDLRTSTRSLFLKEKYNNKTEDKKVQHFSKNSKSFTNLWRRTDKG